MGDRILVGTLNDYQRKERLCRHACNTNCIGANIKILIRSSVLFSKRTFFASRCYKFIPSVRLPKSGRSLELIRSSRSVNPESNP